MKTSTFLMCTLFDGWLFDVLMTIAIRTRIFSQTVYIHKGTAAKHWANKVLFTFSEDAPIEYNNSCVYYKFSRFYGRTFVATLDICPGAPDLKRDRHKMKCDAIEFSNALLRGGNDDNLVSAHHLCILCTSISWSCRTPSFNCRLEN